MGKELGRIFDLRSDTLTTPSAAMRKAMSEAAVGDDVYGEDPTVKRLEQRTAELVGTETAMFVPSGTMANQLAILLHTRPGDSVITEESSHLALFEAGGAAALSGVQFETVSSDWSAHELQNAYRGESIHLASSAVLVFENTHNVGGGDARPLEVSSRALEFARSKQLKTHLDGARLWNAAVALKSSEEALAKGFDTVSVCFSKGLGAPVGSALCMSQWNRARALKLRKRLGGGMRQSGILAAACLASLDNRQRLVQDHHHAFELAQALKSIGFEVKTAQFATNMVYFRDAGRQDRDLVGEFESIGIRASYIGRGFSRLVTHLDIHSEDIKEACSRIRNFKF